MASLDRNAIKKPSERMNENSEAEGFLVNSTCFGRKKDGRKNIGMVDICGLRD